MPATTRRQFLRATATASAALVLDRAPAHAQKRELSFLSTNHFVPPRPTTSCAARRRPSASSRASP